MDHGVSGRSGRTTPGTPGGSRLPGTPARTPRTPGTPSSGRLVRGPNTNAGHTSGNPGGSSATRTPSGGRTAAPSGGGSSGGAITPGTPSSRRNNGRVSIASMGSSTSSSGEGGLNFPVRTPGNCDKSPYNVVMPSATTGNNPSWTPVSPGPSRGHVVSAAQTPSPYRYGSTAGSHSAYQRQYGGNNPNTVSPYYAYDQMLHRGHTNLPNGQRHIMPQYQLPQHVNTSNKSSASSMHPNPKNMFTAIYEYKAQGEDELSLNKGDTIEVLSKDYKISGDEGWWTGKCNGKVGVFPCNFVAPCDLDFSDFPREELLNFYPPHISYDQLNRSDLIGVGGFGKVFRGHYQGQEIAIKTARSSMDEDVEVTRERVRQEARLLWVLKHTNVISLKGVCLEGPDMCLIMEYARGGSLNRVLQSVRRIGPDVLIDWAIQIARGMVYLHHDAPIKLIHRDLKSANGKHMLASLSYATMIKLLIT